MGLGLLVSLLFSFSASANDLFEYRIKALPVSAAGCQTELARVVGEFEKKTGNKVVHAQCIENQKRYDLRLSYAAEKPVDIVTTIPDRISLTTIGFPNESDCLKDVEIELRNFRTETRLEPIIAYCVNSGTSTLAGEFVVRIDAMGTPLKRPYSFGRMVLPNIKTKVSALISEIEAGNLERLTVSRMRFPRGHVGGNDLALHYYSKDPVCMGFDRLITVNEANACDRLLPELRRLLNNGTEKPVGLVCGEWSGETEVNLLSPKDRYVVKQEEAPQVFDSHSSCDLAKRKTFAFYSENLKRKVLGGVCHAKKDSKVVLSVFTERVAPKDCY